MRCRKWFYEGMGMVGEYVSAAWLLGICGAIAFWGYDGFLFSIGIFAGWVGGLLLIGRRVRTLELRPVSVGTVLGRRFESKHVRWVGRISSLVVGTLLLALEMAGSGALSIAAGVRYEWGVAILGMVLIVAALVGGRKSGRWGKLVEGEIVILMALVLTGLVLRRGLRLEGSEDMPRRLSTAEFREQLAATDRVVGNDGAWAGLHFARVIHADGGISVWRYTGMERLDLLWAAGMFMECQVVTETASGQVLVNGKPAGDGNKLRALGFVRRLPRAGNATGPLSPTGFLSRIQESDIGLVKQEVVTDERGRNTVYFAEATSGEDVMSAGNSEMFAGMRNGEAGSRWEFVSMMLGMFFMVTAMPGFLGRYCGMKDESAARGAALVGTLGVALVCGLTLFLGLGAMTSGTLDPTNSNVGLLMLARSFGAGVFALVWVALAAAIMWMGLRVAKEVRHAMGDWSVNGGRAVLWGGFSVMMAVVLAELFRGVNVAVMMGWVIGVAVSGNLAAVVMSLYWKGATGVGVAASVVGGFVVSMGWIVLGWMGVVGFDQPAVVGAPAALVTLLVVSAMTRGRGKTT